MTPRIILALTAALAAATPAHAQVVKSAPPPHIQAGPISALPSIYLGQWCGTSPLGAPDGEESYAPIGDGGYKCRDSEERLTLKRNGFDTSADDHCTFKSIRTTGYLWPVSTKPQKGDWVPEIDVVAECTSKGGENLSETFTRTVPLRFAWMKGGYLNISYHAPKADPGAVIPAEYRGEWCDAGAFYARQSVKRCKSGSEKWIKVGATGYTGWEFECKLLSVKRKDANHILKFDCSFEEDRELVTSWFAVSKGNLHIEEERP
jgi:hypothetical protein